MFKNPQSADPLIQALPGIPPTDELGAWILMSDFVLDIAEPKFYGIVARGVNDPNSPILTIRGPEGAVEWLCLACPSSPPRQWEPRRLRPKRLTTVAGLSLGAALATLFVMENDSKRKFDITTLCTFASPRVGKMEFVHLFNQL